jgi:hypothetical protein
MLLAAAAVAFFLVAAVVDHWLVPGGLSIYGRLAFLAVFLLGGGWYVAREIAPLFVYRINPLFAAQTIERAKPTLKNSLLNFLMLRSNRTGVPEVVLSAVEEQAAANLERTSLEHVVDRTRLIQIGYLLLALVAAFCTYFLLSPKSPLQTVGRVILPWSDLQPPSRVEINDIQPGTATVFRGERASVSAEIKGLEEGEAVTLFFSTADRQSVDQPLRMFVTKESHGRHTVTLPPAADAAALSVASAGFQQDIEYRIEAGDAVSRTHRLSVIQAPNIIVQKLDYEYPEYTRLDRQSVDKTGDIRGVEGTQVTVHAVANQPIASAYLDLGGDGRHKQPMQVASGPGGGQRATATMTLALNDQRTAPLFSHYFVRFVTDRGHENREPIRYRIEVTPDPAPEVQVLRPDKVEAAVPLNAPLTIELEASDELYGLADLRIVANVGGEPAFRRNRSVRRDDPSAPRLVHTQIEQLDRITLADGQKLKAGDVIEYWAEAVDNKLPKPNVTRTEVRKLVIVEPKQDHNHNQQQQPENKQDDGQGNEQDNNQQGNNNNKQANEQDTKNDQQKNDQNNAGQKNQQDKNDDAKKNQRQNKSGENGGDSKNKGQSKDGQAQPNDRNGKGGKDDKNTKRSEGAGDENNRADQSETNNEKSDQDNGAKGGASQQQNPGRENSSSADAKNNQEQNQSGARSQDNNANQQDSSQSDEKQPVDRSDEGEALKRILNHAKEKDGKTPEQQNDAKDDQTNASDEHGSDQGRADKTNDKGANDTKQDRGPSDAKDDQTKRPDSQSSGRDKQRTKTDDSRKGTQPDQNRKQNDAQQTGRDSQKNETSKTEQTPRQDDSQEAAKKGTSKTDQHKTEDQSGQKTGSGEPSPEQVPRPKTDDPTSAQEGAKKEDERKQKQTGSGSNDHDDAKKRPDDQQGKGANNSEEKTDADKSADEKAGGSGAKTTDKPGAEKQDRSKSGATAGDDKNEKSKSGEKKGSSEKGAASDDAKGRAGQPRENTSGEDDTQKDGQPGDAPPRKGNEKGGDKNDAPDDKGTATRGGGGRRDESPPPPDEQPIPTEDDKANLEYARRATDLALDHLRNQLKDDRPDEELLDRLGWSKEDLKKLLARWERLEREAKQPGPVGTKAKENLQERINSLGWKRPGQAVRKASTSAGDAAQRLRDSARSKPPAEYIEGFEAFKRRTSQGAK